MIIISHRGHWLNSSEKNSRAAFERSFRGGFGTETDIRDCLQRLVISHDMPRGTEMTLPDFIEILEGRALPLALNIKSDGLAPSLKEAMDAANVLDWFAFDMSVPDMREYLRLGLPVFARLSEVEKSPVWQDQVAGYWLDGFSTRWYDKSYVETLLETGKKVCVVSPELHGRDCMSAWSELLPLHSHESLMLCTDFPDRARSYFGDLS